MNLALATLSILATTPVLRGRVALSADPSPAARGSALGTLAGLATAHGKAEHLGESEVVMGDVGAGRWIGRVKRGMRSAGALPVYSFRAPSFVLGGSVGSSRWFGRRRSSGL